MLSFWVFEPTCGRFLPRRELALYSLNSTLLDSKSPLQQEIPFSSRGFSEATRRPALLCNTTMDADWRKSADVPLNGASSIDDRCRSLDTGHGAQARPGTGQLLILAGRRRV